LIASGLSKLLDIDYDTVDLIVLPGGRLGTENLGANDLVVEKCKEFAAKKHLAAICAAPSLLAALGLLDGKNATCHPDFEGHMAGAKLTGQSVVTDGRITTGQGLGASFDFSFELVKLMVGEETVEQIKKAICYKH
jgi:4-methyl-5(b-hydroxyethyl)-thiazole monophosphate biosynthesis